MPIIPEGSHIEPLPFNIKKATHWGQLFDSKAAELVDFEQSIILKAQRHYESQGTLTNFIAHQEEGIYIFEQGIAGHIIYEKLANGDVKISRYNGRVRVDEDFITASVGNIKHTFTLLNTVLPAVEHLSPCDPADIAHNLGIDIDALIHHLNGYPAVPLSEEIILGNRQMPQRIGHRVYPNHALVNQSILMDAYPHLFPPSPQSESF